MKREPNPYSKNPMLTVTSTMSISVPSMVAEDVLDGAADKITGVDPAVLDEIKETIREVSIVAALARSEAGDLQGTVDTIKDDMDNTSRLAYGLQSKRCTDSELYVDVKDESGLAYLVLSGNGKYAEVTVDDLQNLVDGSVGGSSATRELIIPHRYSTDVAPCAMQTESYGTSSIIIDLYSKDSSFSGVTALNCGLADNEQYNNTVMTVHGMGRLLFRRSGDNAKVFDLNNLGGTGASNGGSIDGEETVRYTGNQYPYLALHLGNNGALSFVRPDGNPIDNIRAKVIKNADTNCYLSIGVYNHTLEFFNGNKTVTIVDSNGNLVGGSGSSSGDSSSTASSSEATFTVDKLGYYGVNNVVEAYGVNASGTYCLYDVISIRDAYSGLVYPITTTGWACPVRGSTGVYWNKTAQGYRLQFTEDGGRTWSNLGGSSGSSNVAKYLQYDSSGVQVLAHSWNNNPILDWSVEIIDDEASMASGVSVLMCNAIATYSQAYTYTSGNDINGKIIPVLTDGQLSWSYWDSSKSAWTPTSGGTTNTVTSTSSGVSFVPFNNGYMGYNQLVIDQSSGNCISFATQSTNGNFKDTGLEYGLQVALAAFDNANVKLRLSGHSLVPVLQVKKGYNADWEDFVISGGSSGSSSSNDANIDSDVKFTFDKVYTDGVQDADHAMWVTELDYAITPRYAETNDVYPIAAKGFKCPYDANTAVFWKPTSTGNKYKLQLTEDGGNTWSDLGGGSSTTVTTTSSGIAFVPKNSNYKNLIIDASKSVVQLKAASDNSTDTTDLGLLYGLQTSLASFNDAGVRLRLNHSGSGGSVMPVLQVKKGYNADWEDFVISGGSSGSSSSSSGPTAELIIPNQTLYGTPCAMQMQYNNDSSIIIALYSKYEDFDGKIALNCGLATNYQNSGFTTMTVHSMGKLLFEHQDAAQVFDLNNLGGTVVSSDSIIKFYYNDGPSRLLSHADICCVDEIAGYTLINEKAGSTGCVYPIITPGLINAGNSDYRLGWIDRGSDVYELKQTTDGGQTWSSLGGGSSSSSSGATATTGELIIPHRYSTDVAPCAMQTESYGTSSIIIDLYSKNTHLSNSLTALKCGLASDQYGEATTMTVHSMGRLEFRQGSSKQIFDLNNLGGTGSSSSGSNTSSSTNGELTIYCEADNRIEVEGSLSVFAQPSNPASSDSIILELRAEGEGYELSNSQIVLNSALAAVSSGGYPTKALRLYDDAEINCVKWQLRSKDEPYDWSDAPIAATVLMSNENDWSSSGYQPVTVSIHAGGWLNVKNRQANKSHVIQFETLEWLCNNIDKLKALVN